MSAQQGISSLSASNGWVWALGIAGGRSELSMHALVLVVLWCGGAVVRCGWVAEGLLTSAPRVQVPHPAARSTCVPVAETTKQYKYLVRYLIVVDSQSGEGKSNLDNVPHPEQSTCRTSDHLLAGRRDSCQLARSCLPPSPAPHLDGMAGSPVQQQQTFLARHPDVPASRLASRMESRTPTSDIGRLGCPSARQ